MTRAFPWKAPRVNRRGKVVLKHQASHYRCWKSWSTDVTMVLLPLWSMSGSVPDMGPVDLDVLFVLDPRPKQPDRTNLGKALEDILQNLIYANDRQVQGGDIRRVFLGDSVVGRRDRKWEGPERIHFRVTSLS